MESPDAGGPLRQARRAAAWAQKLVNAGKGGIDLVLPPRCLSCGAITTGDGAVCGTCWPTLALIEQPFCRRCGIPFEFDPGADTECGACIAKPPAFDRARAALVYDDASRPLILSLKNGDRMHAGRYLGAWLARAGNGALSEADVVAPVPLHWRRLVSRRYNQSAELAKSLAQHTGLPLVVDLLKRHRPTPTQAGLNPRQRRENVRGAFAVTEAHRARLKGSAVLLVDDVYTTGATVDQCARVLKRAGAARVDVLVLARVVRPASPE